MRLYSVVSDFSDFEHVFPEVVSAEHNDMC